MSVAVEVRDGGVFDGGGRQAGEDRYVVAGVSVDDAHIGLVAIDDFDGAVLVEVEGGEGGGAGEVAGALQPELLQALGGGEVSVGGEIGAEGEEDFGVAVVVDVGEQGPPGGVGAVRVRGYELGVAAGPAVGFPGVHLVGSHDDEVEEAVEVDVGHGGKPVVEAADGFPEGGVVAGRACAVRDAEFVNLVASGQFHHPVVVEVGEDGHNAELVRAHIEVGFPDDFR